MSAKWCLINYKTLRKKCWINYNTFSRNGLSYVNDGRMWKLNKSWMSSYMTRIDVLLVISVKGLFFGKQTLTIYINIILGTWKDLCFIFYYDSFCGQYFLERISTHDFVIVIMIVNKPMKSAWLLRVKWTLNNNERKVNVDI